MEWLRVREMSEEQRERTRGGCTPRHRSTLSKPVFAVVFTAALGAGDARADEPSDGDQAPSASSDAIGKAQRLFAEGNKELEAGRTAEALAKFREVATIKTTAGVLFHIGHCLEVLGKLREALSTFEAAEGLAQKTAAEDVLALSGARIAPLRARVPTLEIQLGGDASRFALVRVRDGTEARVERADARGVILLRLDPGAHSLRLETPSGTVAARELDMAVGQRAQWSVELKELRAAMSPASPAQAKRKTPEPEPREARRQLRLPTVIAAGASVTLAGAGAVMLAMSASRNRDAARRCSEILDCDPGDASTVRTMDGVALATFAAALAAGTTAIVLHFTLPSREPAKSAVARKSHSRPHLRAEVGLGHAGLRGSF